MLRPVMSAIAIVACEVSISWGQGEPDVAGSRLSRAAAHGKTAEGIRLQATGTAAGAIMGTCQPGVPGECDDGMDCTIDSCQEIGEGSYVSTAVKHDNKFTHVVSTGNPPTGDFTTMMWVRIDFDRNTHSTFFFVGGSIAEPRYYKSFYAGTGGDPAGRRTWIQALTSGTPIDPAGSVVLELGEWHHIAMVANATSGGEIKLYVDGILRQQGNAAVGTYVGEFIELLNAPHNEGNDRMIGSFTSWKRFNIQMTEAQIQAEMPYLRAVDRTNLVQEVTFRDITDTFDRSGNGNHFSVNGPALINVTNGPGIQYAPAPICENNPNHVVCSDDVFCNGAEVCDPALGCQGVGGRNCDDGIACTADSCNEDDDVCDHILNDVFCSNALFCDGAEICHPRLGCLAGDPACNDGITCTIDSCNEENASCEHNADDLVCSDGMFCNGAETCHVTLGCQTGAEPSCDDGVACTDDTCNEDTDSCNHITNDANCPDDGAYCSGAEYCDLTGGCISAGDPCPVGQTCNEVTDTCGSCLLDGQCNDNVDCTIDRCVLGGCEYTPNDELCLDDGDHCNGAEYCHLTLGCQTTGNPCSEPLVCRETDDACVECITNDDCPEAEPFCDVSTGLCVECITTADCDENDPCIVGHECADGICRLGSPIDCSVFNDSCNTASCDPQGTEGNCDIDIPLEDGTDCSDGNACTDGDACSEGVCVGRQSYTLIEWNEFSSCLSGPGVAIGAECQCFDLETDDAVDLRDVAEFLIPFQAE